LTRHDSEGGQRRGRINPASKRFRSWTAACRTRPLEIFTDEGVGTEIVL